MVDSKSVCVFCGSSAGKNPNHLIAAESIGKAIGSQEWRLIYGGGSRGLMGKVSQSALENGARVHGIIPRVMTQNPKGHPNNNDSQPTTSKEGQGATILNPDQDAAAQRLETTIVESMHQRKHLMAEKADMGFVALPGGFGTFEEGESDEKVETKIGSYRTLSASQLSLVELCLC